MKAAVRFGASVILLVVLGGCSPAPWSTEPAPPGAPASRQSAEPEVTQTALQTSRIADREAFWRRLTRRFDQPPFTIDYLHRGRGEMVASYDGDLGNYVACGESIGAASPPGRTSGTARRIDDRLRSRLIVRMAGGGNGPGSVSADAVHVVSLGRQASEPPVIVTVRPEAPARTEDGRYCWSTGAMERLALVP